VTGVGHATGATLALLRLEGAAVAVVMAGLAWHFDPPWWLVVLVLVAPDVTIAGYLAGPRVGAALYNAAHTYVGPALAAGLWLGFGSPTVGAVAALWALHIGADRSLGFGLKDPSSFGDTHLGRIGRG
jgi:hypothetical protein